MGRGTSYEIKSEKINNFSLGILKWYDNKPVNIASNYEINEFKFVMFLNFAGGVPYTA